MDEKPKATIGSSNIGGGSSNVGGGDYLSMIGNNQARQPRMRMGAPGGIPNNPKPVVEQKPKVSIMSGLDELENI